MNQPMEAFLHTAEYADAPNSSRAFAPGQQTLTDQVRVTEGSTRP